MSRADRAARIEGLVERTGRLEKMMPGMGHDGTLHYRGATAQLSETQTRVMLSLIERFGAVVSRGELTARAWPDVVVPDNNLDVTVGRLRRRLVLVGLRIRTVRSRGYLLFDPEASL